MIPGPGALLEIANDILLTCEAVAHLEILQPTVALCVI
jgi:hypothetical protein